MSEAAILEPTANPITIHDSPISLHNGPTGVLTRKASLRPPLAHAFTRETAAENARKAVQARAANRKTRIAEASVKGDPYVAKSLTRTCALIEQLEEQLESSTDTKDIGYLTTGIAKLRDVEQKLAMRPLPGSHRPTRARNKTESAPTFEE